MRRHGTLGLILVLPDGTRRLVPAAWTDAEPIANVSTQPPETLGALADLLNAGRVLAALARRLENWPDDGAHLVEEGARAAVSGPVGKPGAPGAVWNSLPDEERVAVVVALARLIAQAAVLQEPDADE